MRFPGGICLPKTLILEDSRGGPNRPEIFRNKRYISGVANARSESLGLSQAYDSHTPLRNKKLGIWVTMAAVVSDDYAANQGIFLTIAANY